MFTARAVAVQPGFKVTESNAAAVAQVCRRLDGIPLAIELAAARVKVLQSKEIAERLDDRFSFLTLGSRTALPRHQTLRAAMDWSYDLLTEPERVLLRRLSVFAGGCTLDAAEQVCAEQGPHHRLMRGQVLDLMSHLVDKSLVLVDQQSSSTRYHLLETIREYARARLDESGEAEVIWHLHAEALLALAENVPPTMTSAARKARYLRFDIEQDNYRAALGWALAVRDAELGLRLVGALGDYWFWWANRWGEGWSWISQFLELPEAVQPKRARATALRAAVNLLHWRAEYAEANRLADESLALFRELGDKPGMAWVLVDKGWNLFSLQRVDEGVSCVTESLLLFREIGDPRGIGWALGLLAVPESSRGRLPEAAALLEESITALQAGGDDAMTGWQHAAFGLLLYNSGDYTRAAELLSQAVALCREGGDADGEQNALLYLASNSLAQGNNEGAAAQLEAIAARYRQSQNRHGLASMLHWVGYVRHLQEDNDAARAALREALEMQQEQQRHWALIESLEASAYMAADLHQPQRAARLLGAAEAARERLRWPFPPGDKRLYDRHLAPARAELEKPAFDTAWEKGCALTLEQAVAYALEMPLTPEQGGPRLKQDQGARQGFGGLTAREREVAAHIAQGESNREIAQALVVSERTIESHVTNILNKLGFTTRAQIRKWAREKNLARD